MGKLSSDGASEFEQLRDSVTTGDTAKITRQDLEQQIAEIADGKFDPADLPIEGSVLDEIGTGLEAVGAATPVVYPIIRRRMDTAAERAALADARAFDREYDQNLDEVRRHERARDAVGSEYDTADIDRSIAKAEKREAFWERARQRAEAVRQAGEDAARARFEAEHGPWEEAMREIAERGDASIAQLADRYLAGEGGPQEFLRSVRDSRALGQFGGADGLQGGGLRAAADAVMPRIIRAFEEGRPDILGTLYRFDRPLAEEIVKNRATQIADAANRGVRFMEPGSVGPEIPVGGYPGVGTSIAQHPDVRAWRMFDDAAKAWSSDVGKFIVDDVTGGLTFRKVSPGLGQTESVLPAGLSTRISDTVPQYVADEMASVADAAQAERAAMPAEPQLQRPGIRSRAAGAEAEFERGRAAAAHAELERLLREREALQSAGRAADISPGGGRPSPNEQARAGHEADANRANSRATNAETNAESARGRAAKARVQRPTVARRIGEGAALGAFTFAGGAAGRSLGEMSELREQLEAAKRDAQEAAAGGRIKTLVKGTGPGTGYPARYVYLPEKKQ